MIEIILTIGIALVPAIVLHEYAHGWVAYRLGDPTAKLSGRLTLNPLSHIDPMGSVIIPGFLFLAYFSGWTSHLMLFGWAKPVPVNYMRLKVPKRDMMLVAVAGPVVNIILAFVFSVIIRLVTSEFFLVDVLKSAVAINLVLAIFNILPIPPLDGSRIVSGILPNRLAYLYNRIEPYGIFIVLLLLQFGLLRFMHPVVEFLSVLLGVSL